MMRDIIKVAAARAFFVSAWADFEEGRGRYYSGCDLMDVAPPDNHPAAISAATQLLENLERDNGAPIETLFSRACTTEHPGDADDAEAMASDSEAARLFGHYLAMESMGHGVAWSDNHTDHDLRVLSIEFTSISIERRWTDADNTAWAEVERRGKLSLMAVNGDGCPPFRGADDVDRQALVAIEFVDEDGEIPDDDTVRVLRSYLADKMVALKLSPVPGLGLNVATALREADVAEATARRYRFSPTTDGTPPGPKR